MKRGPVVVAARTKVRLALNRLDAEPMRGARALLRAMRTGNGPDVVFLSDSTASWVAPGDTDRRPLHLMLADALGPDVKTMAVHGAAYHADLFRRYVRLAGVGARTPVMVVTQSVMANIALGMAHPILGYRHVVTKLDALDVRDRLYRYHVTSPDPSAAEYEEYHRIPFPTLAGDMTIGEYIRRFDDPKFKLEDPEGRTRLSLAFRHTSRIADGPGLPAVEALGQSLRELGAPVVTYQTAVPVESGVRLLGAEFRTAIEDNFARQSEAFDKGLGRDAEVIANGAAAPDDYFIAPELAREHLNERGRRWLTDQLAPRIQAALTSR